MNLQCQGNKHDLCAHQYTEVNFKNEVQICLPSCKARCVTMVVGFREHWLCSGFLFLFLIASQTGNHAQCHDDDGKGEKILKEQD